MKKFLFILKRILQLLFVVAVAVAFCVAVVAAVNKQKQIVCSAVQVNVSYKPFMQLIDEQEVEDEIIRLSGSSIVGKRLSRIDFNTLEQSLEKNPYIKIAEVYYDMDNVVHADIVQRVPLMRVINNDGVSFYLSEERVKMPLHNTFTTNVPLAIGFVQTNLDTSRDSVVAEQLFELAQYITKDSTLKSLIDHIYVNEAGSFELLPKLNYHTIFFGKLDDKMVQKFTNLKTFYREVLMKDGWEKYSRINISIPNQISATRSGEKGVEEKKESVADVKKAEETKGDVKPKVEEKKTDAKKAEPKKPEAKKAPIKTQIKNSAKKPEKSGNKKGKPIKK